MSGPRSPAPGPQQKGTKAPPAHLLELIRSYVKAMMQHILETAWNFGMVGPETAHMGEHLHLCFFSKVSIFAPGVQHFNHSRVSRLGHGANQVFALGIHTDDTRRHQDKTSEENCLGIHLGLALFSSQLDLIVDLTWKTCITWCFWCGVTPTPKKVPERFSSIFHPFTQNLLLFIP